MNIGTVFTIICSLLISSCIGGCVTTKLTNSVTDPRTGKTATIQYDARTLAIPGGKTDMTAHRLETQFGAGRISVGQDAQGLDATNQASMLQAILEWAMRYTVSKAATGVIDEAIP